MEISMAPSLTKGIVTLVLSTQLLPSIFLVGGTLFALTPSSAYALTQADCDAQNGPGKTTYTPSTSEGTIQGDEGYCAPIGVSQSSVTDAQRKQATPPDGCSINPLFFSLSACMKALMSWFGSWFLTMGAALLRLAGWIFDQFIYYIIVAFGKTMKDLQIMDAVERGWTVFRDFSNILIIGFFVFIAISIILGLQEFGQKRLIANVLVIAVLMNFSLLFTKLVIDGSNFVAYQIYSQMARTTGAPTATFDTSQAFLNPMGVSEIWYTYDLVRDQATDTYGFLGFAYGLVGGLMLAVVAAVLFYGCFLILWRGVLFILLMLAAPFAFATYLIPSLAKGEYGWEGWWKMLINNAAFGPLLMILLAISLSIITAGGSKATIPIGKVIADPTTAGPTAWVSILVYLLGTALLFASLRLASSFAGSIGGGYSIMGGVLGRAALLGGAGAFSRTAVNTRGRWAASQMENNKTRMGELKALINDPRLSEAQRATHKAEMERLAKQNMKLRETATRDFSALNTNLGKLLAGKAGVAVGKGEGGFLTPREKTAKEVAKQMDDVTLSKTEATAAASKIVGEQNKEIKEVLEGQKTAADNFVKSTEKLVQTMTQEHQRELNQQMQIHSDATSKKSDAEQQFLNRKISEAERNRAIQAEDAKISDARAKIVDLETRIQGVRDQHVTNNQQYHGARAKISDANQKLGALQAEERALAAQMIDSSHAHATDILTHVNHLDSTEKNLLGKEIRKKFKNKAMTDVFKTIQEETGGDTPQTT